MKVRPTNQPVSPPGQSPASPLSALSSLSGGRANELVEGLLTPDKARVQSLHARKQVLGKAVETSNLLKGALGEFDQALGGLSTLSNFQKLKVESSHPEILQAMSASGDAVPGRYELSIKQLARQARALEAGFPDRDAGEAASGTRARPSGCR